MFLRPGRRYSSFSTQYRNSRFDGEQGEQENSSFIRRQICCVDINIFVGDVAVLSVVVVC